MPEMEKACQNIKIVKFGAPIITTLFPGSLILPPHGASEVAMIKE